MGLFSRRRGPQPNPAADIAVPFEHRIRWSPVAWRGLPTPAPWAQVGVWGEDFLTSQPGIYPGVQLWGGVGSMYVGWSVPSKSSVPSFQQSQQQAYKPGAQRFGVVAPIQYGPIAARTMKRAVFARQVDQSGLAAMSWADELSTWSGG